MIRHKGLRRTTGVVLVILGGVLIWLAPEEAPAGAVLMVAGVALEIAGIALEHRNGKPKDDYHAVER